MEDLLFIRDADGPAGHAYPARLPPRADHPAEEPAGDDGFPASGRIPETAYATAQPAQREGREMKDADVASSYELQRAVVLLAEAINAGNVDARELERAHGANARLFHTG